MVERYSNLIYAVKVWLFSVLCSPILVMISGVTGVEKNLPKIIEIYGLMIVYGGLLSLPSLFIFMIIVYFFTRGKKPKNRQKMNVQIVAIVLCIAPIFLFFMQLGSGGLDPEVMLIGCSYLATISFGIWFFDYKSSHLMETEEIDDLLI